MTRMVAEYNNLLLIGIIVGICLCGLSSTSCSPKPTTNLHSTALQKDESRFQVTLTDVFEDDLAYDDRRGIYLIRDTKTGQEFVGVSGVGISELGSHQAGKVRLQDER